VTIEAIAPLKLRTNIYKGCQRCGGVLRLERDTSSVVDRSAVEYVCLQCGRTTSLAAVVAQSEARAV
jgi:DNA-directed RNA polymerase subunit RPC12/RpoP